MSSKTIELSRHEKIVAVVPEYCRGPGWSNAVVWVHIVDYSTAQHRCESIGPDERTPELSTLFDAGAAMCKSLAEAVPFVVRYGK